MSTSRAPVWGVGGGLGSALLKQLGKAGWQITSIVHNPYQQNGSDFIVADASEPSSFQTTLIEVGQRVEQFEIWIYAAGDISYVELAKLELTNWRNRSLKRMRRAKKAYWISKE